MKKFGQFILGFLPLIVSIALMEGVTIFVMGMSAIVGNWSLITGTSPSRFSYGWGDLSSLWASTDFSTLIMIVYSLVCMIIFGLWYRAVYSKPSPGDIRVKLNAYMIIGLIIIVPGIQILTSYIVVIIATILPSAYDAYYEMQDSAGLTESISAGMLLYSCILAPISEEFIFRGTTLKQFNKCLPFWLANIMQALCFGLFHMNLIQGSYAFALALLLGYVRKKSSNLCCSILLHMIFNFWGTVITNYVNIFADTIPSLIVLFIISSAVIIIGIGLYNKGVERELFIEIPPDSYQGM